MLKVIHKMHEILNQFKGINAGYSTSNKEQMIIQVDGINYRVTFEELGEGSGEQYVHQL